MKISEVSTVFSKLWVKKNPEQFASNVMSFLDTHPGESWNFSFFQLGGHLTLTATAKATASTMEAI
jgi:hypothetical protein